MSDGPGLIGIIAQDTARFTVFASSLGRIEAPQGTQMEWMLGFDIPASLNQLVDTLLYGDGEWLWLMGDDHVIPPDTLMRLLSHDKPIIVPLCMTRVAPYKPVIYSGFDEVTKKRQVVNLDDHPNGGVIPVHSAGNGGMLIQRYVFEAMPRPWFEYGRVDPTTIAEDVHFCDKARHDMGYTIWCDLDTPLGHCTTGIVWPILQEDGWTHGFVMNGGFQITMPRESRVVLP